MAKAKTLILVAAWMESGLVYVVVVPAAGVLGVAASHMVVVPLRLLSVMSQFLGRSLSCLVAHPDMNLFQMMKVEIRNTVPILRKTICT